MITVNGMDTTTDSDGVRGAFQKARVLTIVANYPSDKDLPSESSAPSQQAAVYIAPMDPAQFDALDVKITSPAEVTK